MAVEPAAAKEAPAVAERNGSAAADGAKPQAAGDAAGPQAAAGERLLVLTPAGPLLLAVAVTLDGQPLGKGLDELIDQVLAAAASPGSAAAQPTWAALIANEPFLQSQAPEGRLVPPRQRMAWIERFDFNRDEVVQRGEAAAWLGRDSSGTATAFAVRSSGSYRPDPRATSRLWSLVDADGDGLASSDELHRAPQRLRTLDADDDEMLTPPELAPLREEVTGASSGSAASRGGSRPHAAIHLESGADAERWAYLLGDRYAPRQDLQPASFGASAALSRSLDKNGDDWLQSSELGGLVTEKPHLELAIEFDAAGRPGQPAASIDVVASSAAMTSLVRAAPSRLMATIGDARVVISAHDLAVEQARYDAQGGGPSALDLRQVRVMVHDQYDGLFQLLDADLDGRLSAREIAHGSERLLTVDADGDGQVSGDEAPHVIVAAFLRGERGGEQAFYPPPSEPGAAAAGAPAPAWFRHADFNGDGDVSRREFLGTDGQFGALDANGDGFLERREAAQAP